MFCNIFKRSSSTSTPSISSSSSSTIINYATIVSPSPSTISVDITSAHHHDHPLHRLQQWLKVKAEKKLHRKWYKGRKIPKIKVTGVPFAMEEIIPSQDEDFLVVPGHGRYEEIDEEDSFYDACEYQEEEEEEEE